MPQVNEHPEILLYTRIRKSPYYYASRRHGVQMYSVYNHTYHPRHYGDPVAEYWHLLNGVTLWDVGSRATDRDQRARRLRLHQPARRPRSEQVRRGAVQVRLFVPPDGGIINDPVLMRVEENRFLLSLADSDVASGRGASPTNSRLDVTIKRVGPRPAAGPGAEVQGRRGRSVRREHPRDPLLLPAAVTSSTG